MPDAVLPAILGKLIAVQPAVESKRSAAVAIILTGVAETRTLLIKRAELVGDPWSGQVAFPGGKMTEEDRSSRDTAVRETREEVGVDLAGGGSFLGYYRAFRTHTGDMDVVPVVFTMKEEARVVPNSEVSGYRWVALSEFLRQDPAHTHRFEAAGASREMPAFLIGDYVVWGLTHRIISSLLGLDSV